MITLTISRRRAIIAMTAFLAVAALAVTISVVALTRTADASDKFNDIATGTFFHDPTKWLADNDIADGFGDGSFKPNNGITRGQASYWLSNYNKTIELVQSSINPIANIRFAHTTPCPAGKRAVAGGSFGGAADMHITNSYPNGTGWLVNWETDDAVIRTPTSLIVYALCVPNNI